MGINTHMKYKYKVRDKKGVMKSGELMAENRNLVIQKLLAQELFILSVDEIKESKEVKFLLPFETVKTKDLIIFTRQLSTMLAAGLSILNSLSILRAQTQNQSLKAAVEKISADIQAGIELWEAMSKHPKIFSDVYVSMIRAGETGGALDTILERLGDHLEREAEITTKVKTASIYPSIIAGFAILMVFGIITFIMPSFSIMFTSAGVELPVPTRILLNSGLFLKKNLLLILAELILIIFFLKKFGTTKRGRYIYDHFYLHIPLLGKTISHIVTSRFARTMGTLVKSGIPVLIALQLVENVIGNAVISLAIQKARGGVRGGGTISRPLEETGAFEPMVTQMIAVGEETGSLDEMLNRISDYYDKEIMYSIDAMISMVEPLMIVVVALLVGGVVIATLLPIFEMMKLTN